MFITKVLVLLCLGTLAFAQKCANTGEQCQVNDDCCNKGEICMKLLTGDKKCNPGIHVEPSKPLNSQRFISNLPMAPAFANFGYLVTGRITDAQKALRDQVNSIITSAGDRARGIVGYIPGLGRVTSEKPEEEITNVSESVINPEDTSNSGAHDSTPVVIVSETPADTSSEGNGIDTEQNPGFEKLGDAPADNDEVTQTTANTITDESNIETEYDTGLEEAVGIPAQDNSIPEAPADTNSNEEADRSNNGAGNPPVEPEVVARPNPPAPSQQPTVTPSVAPVSTPVSTTAQSLGSTPVSTPVSTTAQSLGSAPVSTPASTTVQSLGSAVFSKLTVPPIGNPLRGRLLG